jgi:serine/threonine protein kinase
MSVQSAAVELSDAAGPPVLPPGHELADGYEVLEHVRRGADLDCYEVWSAERFCRCFAKTPRPDRADHASTVRHLRREARLLRSLTHPHLVRGYDWLTPDGAPPVLVTENLTGATLSWLLHTHGRLPTGDLAQLGLHLCSALRYLHGRGVMHLDVKPSNIVAVDGVAKLIDLSLARRPGRCTPGYGTVGYLSPEQLVGARVTEAADVWGLGLVLYEAATGTRTYRIPSAGSHASMASYSTMGRYESVLVRPVRRIRALRRLPVPVADAIDGCLSLRPKERPTLAQLSDALETLAG